MSNSELVPMVGGPKDGEAYGWATVRTLIIPTTQDIKQKVTADGDIVTIFGKHTYELKCYAKDGEKAYRWDYVGYEPPK